MAECGPMVQRQLHNHRGLVQPTLVMNHHHMDCHGGGLEIHHTPNINISEWFCDCLYVYI